MKTTKRHHFEIVFTAFLAGLIGASFGYWFAAATIADKVREALAP